MGDGFGVFFEIIYDNEIRESLYILLVFFILYKIY